MTQEEMKRRAEGRTFGGEITGRPREQGLDSEDLFTNNDKEEKNMKKDRHINSYIQELIETVLEAWMIQQHLRRDLLGRKAPNETEAKWNAAVALAMADLVIEKLEVLGMLGHCIEDKLTE